MTKRAGAARRCSSHRAAVMLAAAACVALTSPAPARGCVCCSNLPCPYAPPKGYRGRPGCWPGAGAATDPTATGGNRTGGAFLQAAAAPAGGSYTGHSALMGWFSPSSTLTTEFDEGLCLVPPDPSVPGIPDCMNRPVVAGPGGPVYLF